MPELTFSSAEAADIPVLFRLNSQLIQQYEDLETIDFEKVLQWVQQKLNKHINKYTCIWLNNQKVGYYRLIAHDDSMELDDFYIFPEFQNQGIGTAVLQKCIADSVKPMELYVFTKNVGAIRFYTRMGFKEYKRLGNTRMIMICND